MDTASTSDAVTFITYVQSLKRKIKQFEKQVEVSLWLCKFSNQASGLLGHCVVPGAPRPGFSPDGQ